MFTPLTASTDSCLKKCSKACFPSTSLHWSNPSPSEYHSPMSSQPLFYSWYWFATFLKFECWISQTQRHNPQDSFFFSFDWGAAAQRPITSLCEGDYCLSVLLNKSVWWATMDQYTRTTWGECNRLKSLICNFFFFQMCSYVGLRRSPYRSNKEKLVRRRISPLRPH